jgi:hypothetical protein
MVKCRKGKCAVYSHKTGKRLSKPTTKAKAVKRLRQIQYFKNRGK